jgi:tRNA A-37 threonylcarbamoyl transferase component Bud32
MQQPTPKSSQLAPTDETLDANLVPGATPPKEACPCPKVQLVEGSGPEQSSETRSLLQVRLRGAALVLLLGSAAFLIREFLTFDAHTHHDQNLVMGERIMFWLHVVHVSVLAIVSVLLWRKTAMNSRQLRFMELVVFGWTAVFFIRVQHLSTLHCATEMGFIPNPVAMWSILVFTYAIFIPNTWRRAAVIIGLISATPIVWLLVDITCYERIASVAKQHDYFSTPAMLMAMAFGSSVFGTHMIGNLRREAYEARQLGQYRLRHLIGAGGMGEVYLAEHQMLKRPCAIKVIRPGKAHDARALARFELEVRATATLTHWNTVEIFDYGSTDDGTFYYVMEYLPGLNLADLVDRHGALPPERAIHLLAQTCDALGEAHGLGLIHRDLKPGNIFAAHRGGVFDVAKLLDFGLAKCLVESQPMNLTQEGAITGSPMFMSPEQALGEVEPDARSDIYSLGAVAYYLLCGRPPFQGDKAMRVIMAHVHEPPPPLSQISSDIPADLERVVMRCLAKDPADRYQNVTSLGEALRQCVAAGLWTRQRAAEWWQESEGQIAESPLAEIGSPSAELEKAFGVSASK